MDEPCAADQILGSRLAERDKTQNAEGRQIMLITKDSIIGEVLDAAPSTAPFFTALGMHCLGCMHARSETVEQACAVHHADVAALVERLNQHLAKRGE